MKTNKILEWAKKHYIVTFIIIAGLLGAIIGDDTNTTKTIKESTEVQKNIVKVNKENRCLNVSLELIKNIESGLSVNGGGNIENVKAVKSNDFKNVYFIAGKLKGEGINDSIVIFTSNSLEVGKGMIGSVNNMAKEFSVYPKFKTISINDDGIKEVKECIK